MFDLPRVWEYGGSVSTASDTHQLTHLPTVTEVDAMEWNELVDRRPEGTIFHRYEWIAAIEAAFPYTPRHLTVRKDGNLVGLLPQFEMDLPKVPFRQMRSTYPGFGGPVIGTDRGAVLGTMLAGAADRSGGRRVLHEIRACNPELLRYHDHLYRAGYRPARYKARFVLDLDRPYEAILDGMNRSRRRGIERGRTTDHRIEVESLDPEVIDRLHPVHVQHMAHVGGEAFPKRFFDRLATMDEEVLVLSLFFEGEYAGSFVELLDESHGTVHGFIAALPADLYEEHVSELMYDAVIRWARDAGYETYDFGGASGDFENGIFRFKEGFGGRLAPNFYWERGFGPIWPIIRLARSLYIRQSTGAIGRVRNML